MINITNIVTLCLGVITIVVFIIESSMMVPLYVYVILIATKDMLEVDNIEISA